MGGDQAPSAVVDGAIAAARHLGAGISLVGPTAVLEQALASTADWSGLGVDIVDAPDVIAMTEAPAAALRRKPRASIRVAADVVVCDGFTGNVVLKTSEGLMEAVETLLGDELRSTFASHVGYLLSRRAFRRFLRRVDYSEYGGALLLGVARPAVVGHGRSSATAVRNGIAMAHRLASGEVLRRVEREIAAAPVREDVR